jgi:Spy/CpxP family protein refolding chaperone
MKTWMLIPALLIAAGAHAQHSPYAAERHHAIKALSPDEQAALLDGKGMGFAKAAELNGYPGPSHVIELAEPLGLSDAQLAASRDIFTRMQRSARAEGAALVEAERALDALYSTKAATRDGVDAQLSKIEIIRARLRGVHLNAHLEQAALLTPAQLTRYAELRGYESNKHPGH